uniref:F-box associated domain-containing protein n=1 Tax=Leersia perrieri TaxID=77586 RepID=A0A0D9XUG0_9ORYZ
MDSSGGFLGFLPQTGEYSEHDEWCVLDHCNGLLLCRNETSTYRLFVCNPATRRWEKIPNYDKDMYRRAHTTYLPFDPALSPSHYEVFMIPKVPEPEMETTRDGIHVKVNVIDDPCRTMEWPPSPWRVDVFSSRTGGLWKERAFVREGEPLGTVEEIRLDPLEPIWYGTQQRYGVYYQGALYVHCRGGFVARFSLSNDTYQIIKTPETNSEKPYFGRSKKGLCFGIITRQNQLQVWILRESYGQMEWILTYKDDLKPVSAEVRSPDFPNKTFGPWIIEDETYDINLEKTETVSKVNSEWDSDNDDFISVAGRPEGSSYGYTGVVSIFGFHPYKEIIFLETSFDVAAYHLNSSKIQFLGFSRPESYYLNYTNGQL